MFKTEFYIRISAQNNSPQFKKVKGWGEVLEAPDKSIIEIRLDKRGSTWAITEASSGLGLLPNGHYPTRAAAIQACTPEFLQAVSKRLNDKDVIAHIARLADYILAAE